MKKLILTILFLILMSSAVQAATLSAEAGKATNVVSYRTTDLSYSAVALKVPHGRFVYSKYKVVRIGGSKAGTAALGLRYGVFNASIGAARFREIPYGLSGHWQFDLSASLERVIGSFVLGAGWEHVSRGKKVFKGSGRNHGLDWFVLSAGINF